MTDLLRGDVRRGECQRRNYDDAVQGVARLYREPRSRPDLFGLLLYVVCIASLTTFVTGSLATPIRDELASFLVFVFTGSLIVRRIRIRRRVGRRT